MIDTPGATHSPPRNGIEPKGIEPKGIEPGPAAHEGAEVAGGAATRSAMRTERRTAGRPRPIPGVRLTSELRARPGQYFIYSGHTLMVVGTSGLVSGSWCEGVYFENTRLLSRYDLQVNGVPVTPSGVSPVGGANFLGYYGVASGNQLREQATFLEDARSLGEGVRIRLTLANYAARRCVQTQLDVRLGADFADIMEAEEDIRQQVAPIDVTWDETRQELTFRYLHPRLDRAVAVRVVRAPGMVRWRSDPDTNSHDGERQDHDGNDVSKDDNKDDHAGIGRSGVLSVSAELGPHEQAALELVVEPIFDGVRHPAPNALFTPQSTPLGRVREALRQQTPALVTTNAAVARAWQTATSDLASLPLGLPDGPATPIAGLPLYQQFFGRDSLTISWQALLAMPDLLRDALKANAAWQGTIIDNWRDEEPGKMIHQARRGPLSVLGFNPHDRYYGDYATPPDFLSMLGQYLLWTNDLATVRDLLPTMRRAIEWCERYGDLDGDGFLEYVTRSRMGVKNQGWKDSWDGILYPDGTVVANPIACVEIQGYWYAALRWAAFAFFLAGDRAYALELLAKAHEFKRRFDAAFWMEDEGFYCLGLDPEKRQIRSIAANAGQVLVTGIAPREKGWRVARRLMQPDLFSGWGVRTLSSEHPAYNPFGYHLGSVWPVTQGTFGLGLARYGCWDELHRLAEGFFAATQLFAETRLPEVMSGLPRDPEHPHPGLYPNSNEPQGWSASSVVIMLQALLGLIPVAPLHLLVVDPHLPTWLPSLRLEGIRVGDAQVDLEVERARDGQTHYRVTRREGAVRVVRQPPPEAPHAGPLGRAVAALGSLLGSLWPFG